MNRNARMALGLVVVISGMTGMAFASVPLYRAFCAATGYGGTPDVTATRAPGAVEHKITVMFEANTHPGLPWMFKPVQSSITLPLGEEQPAFYEARNDGSTAIKGVAVYNVTPEKVGKYFHKTACFCFNEQTLQPGQEAQFPLSFWVDPKIATDPNTADVTTITLNYSFFQAADDPALRAAMATAGPMATPAPQGGKLVR
jgi:cytochrome c oxidase assembly protein subunit 11